MSDHENEWARALAALPAPTIKPADCTHPSFIASVSVNRFEDTGLFLAELSICCRDCREPMRFKGIPAGLTWDGPTASIDGLVANLPIEPEIEKRLQDSARYVMPAIPAKH